MIASTSTVNELSAFLEELQAHKTDLHAELEAIERKIDAVHTTLQLVSDPHPAPRFMVADIRTGEITPGDPERFLAGDHRVVSVVSEINAPAPSENIGRWVRILRGATQMEALIRIAKESGNAVRVKDAKLILLATGFVKGSPKHVYSHIYNLLDESPDFERLAPGAFKLVSAASPTLSMVEKAN